MKFYMHAGGMNHGCEAIVRSTVGMTSEPVILYSEHPEEDRLVGLDQICSVRAQGGKRKKSNPVFLACKMAEVVLKKPSVKYRYAYKNVINECEKNELFLSIGGDNYCYNATAYLMYLNRVLNEKGARTGLWGCSVEPDMMKNKSVVEDMKRYAFISARESLTFHALKEAGVSNVFLYPDPAFTLGITECELPDNFQTNDVIGINFSPLIQKRDNTDNLVMDNYIRLVKFILENTNMDIALIPHVCKPGNDDRAALEQLAARFANEKRIFMVNTEGYMNCQKLKYIISKCRMLITARTHASIAGYSTSVPTLVAGYSVKALGIANDLFGSAGDYVVDIRGLTSPEQLKNKFALFLEKESDIRKNLNSIMPDYIGRAREAGNFLKS